MTKIKKPAFRDTLGKRDIVKTMLYNKTPLAEICKAVGASREEIDNHYGDLYEQYKPTDYVISEEDRNIVWRMSAYGMTQERIAYRLGISSATLRNHFRRELDGAKEEWIDDVATTLVTQAKEGSVPAGIFLLKVRAGWKETAVNEVTGKDGAPISIRTTNDLSVLSDEELEIEEQLAQKLADGSRDPTGTL